MTLENILTNLETFVGVAIGWMESLVDVVTTNPILFIFVVAVPLVGLGIGLLNRVIRAN